MRQTVNDYGSFRDPAGCIFSSKGSVFRSVCAPGVEDFSAARKAGVFETLKEAGLLIDAEEIEPPEGAPDGTVFCLRHPMLPFVSYPWEWPFSMLKDAALLHLDLMERLIPLGFWLRDASAFNVQYDGAGLKLIDILSIGKRIPKSPWVAYGQFCAHFLAPLVMAGYGDIRLMGLWRHFINGYPLDLAASVLPLGKRFRLGLMMHLVLHARFQKNAQRRERLTPDASRKTPTTTDAGLIGLIRSLRKTVSKITWKNAAGLWPDYDEYRTYDTEAVQQKTDFLIRVLDALRPEIVWDLGANTGEFSHVAERRGAFVVSIEQDPACVEKIYQTGQHRAPKGRILPLVMDLSNPSPALGWGSRERMSLNARGPADLVLVLALVHHLVLSASIPFHRIGSWLSEIAKSLVVEFVPSDDPMVRQLLSNRPTGHLPYDFAAFHAGFGPFFESVEKLKLKNGRTLIWYRRRSG